MTLPYPNLWKGNVWRTAPPLLQTNTAFQSSGKTKYPPGEIAGRAYTTGFVVNSIVSRLVKKQAKNAIFDVK